TTAYCPSVSPPPTVLAFPHRLKPFVAEQSGLVQLAGEIYLTLTDLCVLALVHYEWQKLQIRDHSPIEQRLFSFSPILPLADTFCVADKKRSHGRIGE